MELFKFYLISMKELSFKMQQHSLNLSMIQNLLSQIATPFKKVLWECINFVSTLISMSTFYSTILIGNHKNRA